LEKLKESLPPLNELSRIDCLNQVGVEYTNFALMGCSLDNEDSALLYASKANNEASKFGYKAGKICSLLLLAKGQLVKEDYKLAIRYISDPLLEDDKIDSDTLLGEKYFLKGELALKKEEYIEAVRNYNSASQFFLKASAAKKQAIVFKSLCDLYFRIGDFEKSFDYCYRAHEALQPAATGFEHQMFVWSWATMSIFYNEASDYHTAANYLLKAIAYGKAHDVYDPWLDYAVPGIYTAMGRYDSAEYYWRKLPPTNNPFHLFARGELYLAEKNFPKAIELLISSLDTLKKYNDEGTLSYAYTGIGKAYLFAGKIKLAKDFANEGLYVAAKYNDKRDLMGAYEVLSDIYSKMERHDSAYFFLKKYMTLKDSTLSRQFLLRLYYSKIISDSEKELIQLSMVTKDNSLKNQELRQKTFLQGILVSSLFILFLIGGIMLRVIGLRRKNERLQQEKQQAQLRQQTVELEMQALRAQMNPHFIFNCLNSINRFIFKNENDAASKYLTRFSRLIRMVLIHSQKQAVSLEDELEMLRLYLDMECLRFKDSFHYNLVVPSSEEMGMVFVPPLILQPFCENAIWHGLLLKEGNSRLDISVFKEGGFLNCIIADNGIGRIRSAALKKERGEDNNSMGLRITGERLALFNKGKIDQASFEMEDLVNDDRTSAGTRVKIKIAYKNVPVK
jgi:tetratricopeptide (TPR) repeat protein